MESPLLVLLLLPSPTLPIPQNFAMARSLALLSLAAGAAATVPATWCLSGPPASWPVCNTSLSLDARSADIVSRLSIQDKISALGTGTPALNSIGLPGYKWVTAARRQFGAIVTGTPPPPPVLTFSPHP